MVDERLLNFIKSVREQYGRIGKEKLKVLVDSYAIIYFMSKENSSPSMGPEGDSSDQGGPPIELEARNDEQLTKYDALEDRYDRLVRKKFEIERYRHITFFLSSLQSEGLQTLITMYGPGPVLDAIKNGALEARGDFSMFDVVKILEPNKVERAKLYEQMIDDAEQKATQFDERWHEENQGRGKFDYFQSVYGSSDNFLLSVILNIKAMQQLENPIFRAFVGRKLRIFSMMQEFATYVFETPEVDGGLALRAELEEVGNDIFRLVEQRYKNASNNEEGLRIELDHLHSELNTEVNRITDELNANLEEAIAPVNRYMDELRGIASKSKEVHNLQNNALLLAEERISSLIQETNKEIKNRTENLHRMMIDVATRI